MDNVILAIVKSSFLREAILQNKAQFFGPVVFKESLEEYYKLDQRFHVELIILEYDVFRFLDDDFRLHFYNINCPRVIITKADHEIFAFPVPGYSYLGKEKNITMNDFVSLVNDYYQPVPTGSVYSEGEELQFITRHPKMLEIFENIKRIAVFDTHILLLGESGTGKDVLAKIIHNCSRRKGKPMVKVNCAAIPPNLLETEMFGFRKGAFTNAYEDKIGKIQLANGSTLFLDEIGDLDIGLQAKLLRVIDTGELDIIGGLHPIKVDVRIISATNQDLTKAIEDGKFRKDLYYRLNVVNFRLIPLRERPEDIPLLIRYFTNLFNKKYKKRVAEIKREALKPVFEYDWPGNVRELRHFVERLIIQCTSNIVDRDMVKQEIEALSSGRSNKPTNKSLEEWITEQEKNIIIKTLKECDFKILETARKLQISRQSLFRKIKKFGIDIKKLKKMRYE